jgi:hypothetical protein
MDKSYADSQFPIDSELSHDQIESLDKMLLISEVKTIRERIIERIIAQLEKITVDNGYQNEIGVGRVYREKAVIEERNVPSIAIWELSERHRRNSFGGTVRILMIKVEAIVQTQANKHPAEVSNTLLGDLEKALIMYDTTLDEIIEDIQNTSAEITHFPPEQHLAGAIINFTIKYVTEWGNPYTQS